MKSGIWNYHCPSISCHLHFNVCFSITLTHFPFMIYLLGNLGVFWNLKSALDSVDAWIIAYSLVEFQFYYTRLYSLHFFGKRTQRQWSVFFPLLQPSLNNDSLGLWGFASHFNSGPLSTLVLLICF